MKVAMVTYGLQSGGTRTHIINFARVIKRDIDLVVVCLYPGPFANELLAQGVKVWSPQALNQPSPQAKDLYSEMKRFFFMESIELVHTHDTFGGTFGRQAALNANIPIVHTQHASPIHYHQLTAEHFPDPVWVKQNFAIIDKFLHKKSDRIIAVSRAVGRELVAIGIDPKHIDVIPNGVFVPDESPSPNSPRATYQVSWVGRFSKEKNPLMMVRVAANILAYLPEAEFLMVGQGANEDSAVRSLAVSLGVSDRLTLLDHMDSIDNILRNSDILLLTSLSEGLPMVVLEAMANSTPVVATNVGGLPELIDDGVNGFLVGPGEIDRMADRAITLLRDHDRRSKLGLSARMTITRHHDIRVLSRMLLSLYNEVIGISQRGRAVQRSI